MTLDCFLGFSLICPGNLGNLVLLPKMAQIQILHNFYQETSHVQVSLRMDQNLAVNVNKVLFDLPM